MRQSTVPQNKRARRASMPEAVRLARLRGDHKALSVMGSHGAMCAARTRTRSKPKPVKPAKATRQIFPGVNNSMIYREARKLAKVRRDDLLVEAGDD